MPSFFLDHLALVKVPAYKNAEPAKTEREFPSFYFHTAGIGFNAQNTGQALELASHGFVVVGVQHPYGAVITVFPDGTIANNNPAALPGRRTTPMNTKPPRTSLPINGLAIWDIRWIHLKIQNEDPANPFYGMLDLNRVGVYGHSTGGGAAIQFCGTDPRCTALLGLDPFMRPVSVRGDRHRRDPASVFHVQPALGGRC